MNIQNRVTGVYIIDNLMSNPNGDPDCGGAPRTDLYNHGYISPASLKSKIRSPLADLSSPVAQYFKKEYDLSEKCFCIFESLSKGFGNISGIEALNRFREFVKENGPEALLDRYWDIRLFGTTALETNITGKDHVNFKRTGCIQISVPVTVAPVEIVSASIIKKAPLDEKKAKEENVAMGNQAFQVVRHGIYVGTYNINPMEAPKTKASGKDVDLFKAIFPYAYDLNPSASRAGTRMVHVFHAEHSNPIGSFNPFQLVSAATPKVKEGVETPLSINDYEVPNLDEVRSVTGIESIEELG